jgi:hypothetical protein
MPALMAAAVAQPVLPENGPAAPRPEGRPTHLGLLTDPAA